MEQRKKILLGNKDILTREIEDFYININLSRDNKEIIPNKYDNVFDLTKFYDQERNQSRNFIIYGTIDSYIVDCNDLKITVYQSENMLLQDKLCELTSDYIVNGNAPFKNLYGNIRGKYIINNIPSTFTGCSVFLKIEKPNGEYFIDSQQLIFTTLTISQNGEKIIEQLKYGLNEAVTDCDGNYIEINNDFDFFYNKHWIKKNLFLINTKTKWIADKDSLFCITETNKNFHNRTVLGIFNTGFASYSQLKEVYEINEYPIGNYKPNPTVNMPDYIPPFLYEEICKSATSYTANMQIKLIPADGNEEYTAPVDKFNLKITPDDFDSLNLSLSQRLETVRQYFQTENIIFTTSGDSNLWQFKYFEVNEQQNLSNPMNIKVMTNLNVKPVYQEICPLSLNVSASSINCTGTTFLNNKPVFISISPLKKFFLMNENVTAKTIDDNYYIDSYVLNGNVYNAPIDNKIFLKMTGNTDFLINYNKYIKLTLKSNAFWFDGYNYGEPYDNPEIAVKLSLNENFENFEIVNILNSANSGTTLNYKCGETIYGEILTKTYSQRIFTFPNVVFEEREIDNVFEIFNPDRKISHLQNYKFEIKLTSSTEIDFTYNIIT